LCAITGLSVADLNAHLRSGEVPFEPRGLGEIKDEQGRIWSNFTLDNATHLLAAQQLTSAGLSWSEAVAILKEPRAPVPRRAPHQAASYYVVRAEFMREGGGEPNFRPRFAVCGGPLSDIVAAVEADLEQYNRQSARTAHQKISVSSLVATDLVRARRVAAARAEELGIAPEQALRVDPDAEQPEPSGGQGQ
jgi:hypothetical protein